MPRLIAKAAGLNVKCISLAVLLSASVSFWCRRWTLDNGDVRRGGGLLRNRLLSDERVWANSALSLRVPTCRRRRECPPLLFHGLPTFDHSSIGLFDSDNVSSVSLPPKVGLADLQPWPPASLNFDGDGAVVALGLMCENCKRNSGSLLFHSWAVLLGLLWLLSKNNLITSLTLFFHRWSITYN